jgi:hypothetical protein
VFRRGPDGVRREHRHTSGTSPAPTATPRAIPVTTTVPTTTLFPTTVVPIDTRIGAYGNCTSPSVEPVEIVLACADYGALLEGLHWTSWTATSATAVGTLVYNDCVPNCASGNHHIVPGTTVTLTIPVHGASGSLVWSEVQESPEPRGYETGPYHGGPQPLPTQPDQRSLTTASWSVITRPEGHLATLDKRL